MKQLQAHEQLLNIISIQNEQSLFRFNTILESIKYVHYNVHKSKTFKSHYRQSKNLQLFSPFKHLEMIGRLSWEQSGRPG